MISAPNHVNTTATTELTVLSYLSVSPANLTRELGPGVHSTTCKLIAKGYVYYKKSMFYLTDTGQNYLLNL